MDNLTPITREEMLMNDEPLTPITREEKILAGEDLNPVTRREYFLKKYRHAGGDVMVEGLSVTENGTYTAPEGKAYSPVEVNVPLPENAYLLKEASGSLVSFSDGADLPMPSFICNIDANQDLHGYDAPWVGGAGKNKCPVILSDDGSTYGYAATVENDGVITVNGTWIGTSNNVIATDKQVKFNLPAGSYVLNGTTVDNYNDYGVSLQAYNWNTSLSIANTSTTGYAEFTLEAPAEVSVRVYVYNSKASGKTIPSGGIKLYPMIRLSSISDASWEPYENICPISGHTGVDAVISPTTEASAGTTYSVSWQTEAGEVYGGEVDLVSGVLTATHKYMSFDGTERWSLGTSSVWYTISDMNLDNMQQGWCNYFPVKTDSSDTRTILMVMFGSDGNKGNRLYLVNAYENGYDTQAKLQALVTGMQIVYPLAEAQTYQLDGNQIKSLLGNNNAWCNTGDVDIDYFAKEVE